jgi:hypothetical protein
MFTKMLGEMMMLQELSNDDKKTHACNSHGAEGSGEGNLHKQDKAGCHGSWPTILMSTAP